MRRFLFWMFCVAFVFHSLEGMAQRFRTAIVIGATGSQVDGDDLAGYNKPGMVAGLLSNTRFNEKWSAQFEMLYMQKGSRTPADPFDSTGQTLPGPYYRLRLQYIEIPVLLNFHYKFRKKASGLVEAGVSYGRLIKAVEEYAYYYPLVATDFEKNDVNINLGLGFGLGQRTIFHIRYAYSVLPIRRGTLPGPIEPFGRGWKNNVLAFSIRFYLSPAPEQL